MTFSRANPLGWIASDPLTPAQVNAMDLNISRALDGFAGGTYNPSSALVINGSGIGGIFNAFTLNGAFTQTAGASHIQTGASLEMDAGSTFHVHGACEFDTSGTVYFRTGTTLRAEGTLLAANTCTSTFSGTTHFQGSTTDISVPLQAIAPYGRFVSRVYYPGDVDIAAYAIASGSIIILNSGVASVNHAYVLNTTGALDGDTLSIINLDSTYKITVTGWGMGGSFDLKQGTTKASARFVFNGVLSRWDCELVGPAA